MTFKVYGEIEIDGKAARVEIKGVDDALEKAARGADKFSFSGRGAAAGMGQLKGETTLAAGSVATLGAQFNDIGVMLAAGQNPLQLAIQQGTQITQVFGNAGAAARVGMLKSALASVVSPINLVTIGVIAGGAALAQWGLGMINAGEETQTFEDTLDDLEQALTNYKQAADVAMLSTAELEARFGTANEGLQTSLQLLADIARSEAQQAIDATAQSLASLFEMRGDGDQRMQMAEFFDLNIGFAGLSKASREARDNARELTSEFLNQQIALQQSSGDLDAQIAILTQMVGTAQALAEAKDGVSAAEEQIIKQLAEALSKMEQQRGQIVASERDVTSLSEAYQQYASSRLVSQRLTESAARSLLAELTSQAEMNRLIARYGEDSAQVTAARLAEERKAFRETELSKDMSEELRDALLAAWDAANGIANVDVAGNITFAADEAGRLAAALDYARSSGRYSGRGGDPRQFDSENRFSGQFIPTPEVEAQADALLRSWRPKPAGRGGGRSAASEAERERQAVDDLIRSLQEQLDLVRETDPVQKEMIRNRETLKAATDAEKQSVEQLIASRIAEEAAIERATEQADFFKDITYDALEGLILRGEKGADVIANLADALAQAALQSALLGTGPLAGLFGTADGGGLLGIIRTALFPGSAPGQADGGIQYGVGGPRDDLLPRWISPGEFIVNAQATAQNRALLEYINGGGLVGGQGFAAGGMPIPVPMPNTQGGGAGSQGRVVISLAPSPLFEAQVIEASQGVFVEGMAQYRAQGLPQDVERISLDPGRRG